ncbi:sensor histidine kinase [Nocardia sp. NPDC050799]|uniref:sensor histidine kinase n=1 Tax=Nocardia sp. NPDC050799 TaxID=3154842 RepID=UPI0033E408EC
MALSGVAAVAMIALALEAAAADTGPVAAFLAASLSCAALPAVVRHVLVATAMQAVAFAALGLGTVSGSTLAPPLPVVAICVVVVHVTVAALRHDWKIAVGVWWTLVGVGVAVTAVDDRVDVEHEPMLLAVLASGSLAGLFAGIAHRQRARIRAELAAARRDIAVEHARRTLAEERTRIARELHDVVAHSMSVIHMQATSAPYRLTELDSGTRAEFTAIADGARGALDEMRRLLGVLRASDTGTGIEPAPGQAQLPALIDVTRRSGSTVTLIVDPELGELPATVGTTAYRIVQEALSNVIRHAQGAAATVRLEQEREGLAVTIVNEPGARRSIAVPDDPERPRHGVIGMRERAEHLGGELSHGPTTGGGFRVRAWLPIRPIADPVAEEHAR